jgi:hypothetical protein
MAYPMVSSNLLAKSATAKVMTNADIIFTVTKDIIVFGLASTCVTANDATASTLQYTVVNANGTTTISGASASLANAAIGVRTIAQLSALATAPTVTSASGVGISPVVGVLIPGGSTIKIVIGVGTTTGTWTHELAYQPLESGAFVTA